MGIEDLKKKCSVCKEAKSKNDFRKDKRSRDGIEARCRICASISDRKFRANRPSSYTTEGGLKSDRKRHLKRTYGIKVEDYDAMILSQDGKCEICKSDGTDSYKDSRYKRRNPLCVDHNHETKKVRGLLCRKCNFMIGASKDNADVLLSAIAYLNKYNGPATDCFPTADGNTKNEADPL